MKAERRLPVIAIDGPAGAGKSTVGRGVATALGLVYIDTGAMYRAIGLRVARSADPEVALARAGDEAAAARLRVEWDGATEVFRIFLDGEDVSAAVRSPEAALWASRVAAIPRVREVLVALQRELAAGGGVVMEGRDIGTVVLPDADLKVFLEADAEARARRRHAEEGRAVAEVKREMGERDTRDSTRSVAPLQAAVDAMRVDTTGLSAAEVVEAVVERLRARRSSRPGLPG